jgi:hypothetical protein
MDPHFAPPGGRIWRRQGMPQGRAVGHASPQTITDQRKRPAEWPGANSQNNDQ